MTKLYGHAKELHNRYPGHGRIFYFLSGVACLDGDQGVPGTLHSYAVPACYSLHWGRGRLAATRLKTAADRCLSLRSVRVDRLNAQKPWSEARKVDYVTAPWSGLRDGVLRLFNGANHSSHEPHKVLHKYAV